MFVDNSVVGNGEKEIFVENFEDHRTAATGGGSTFYVISNGGCEKVRLFEYLDVVVVVLAVVHIFR